MSTETAALTPPGAAPLEGLPPISAAPEANPALDARALFRQGLALARQLSHGRWSDHNLHDPGITMLEGAAYALSELAYRHSLPIDDRLTSEGGDPRADFFSPQAVLPQRPWTVADRRRAIIDLPGVQNAWWEPVDEVRLYADLRRRELRQTPPEHPDWREVILRGLSRVRVQCMDSVRTVADEDAVIARVRSALELQRNLAEDVLEVVPVPTAWFGLCGEFELAPAADVTEVAAQLLMAASAALLPPLVSHPLAELLARGQSLPDALAGPLMGSGFLRDDELRASELPAELRLSDLMAALAAVPGVVAIRELRLQPVVQRLQDAPGDAAEPPPRRRLDRDPDHVAGDLEAPADPWRQPVAAGHQPRLSLSHGRLVFSKRGLPVQGWNIAERPTPVRTRLQALRDAAQAAVEAPASVALPNPLSGRRRALAPWRSMQLDFPAVYGIGEQGLGGQASPQRQAQALQLQAWLLLFDQLMADQLALLAQSRRRLSVDPEVLRAVARAFTDGALQTPPVPPHVLVSQVVRSVRDFERLYPPGISDAALSDALETPAQAAARQQALLDHLLARLAEDFADYAAAMGSAFGSSPERLIADKCRFLAEAPALVHDRAGAMNQRPERVAEVWDTDNVSGLERRLAALLGMPNPRRRNLGLASFEAYDEVDKFPDGTEEFRFRVRHASTSTILLSASVRYPSADAAREGMVQAVARAQRPDGLQRLQTRDGKFYFNVVDEHGHVLARRIQYFATEAQMEAAIAEMQDQLAQRYSGEGLYLVEHLLLRPRQPGDPLLDLCGDLDCDDCAALDPYSHRVQVLLPAYAGRFVDLGFRQFVEQTIRREMPAHLLPTVCWLGPEAMLRFERAWHDFLMLHMGFSTPDSVDRVAILTALIRAMGDSKNVYPSYRLFDCLGDESRPPFVLGKTSLGHGPDA